MARKKLLAVAPYNFLPYYSGGQKFIAKFLHYLGEESELTVITVNENDFSDLKNYKPEALLKPGSFSRYTDISLISKITALVKKEQFDAVIWEHPYFAWLAYSIKKRTGIRTIVHTHNIEHQRFRSTGKWWWNILKKYERWSFRFADHILFITPEDQNFAIKEWNISADKCIEVPFGIEMNVSPTVAEKKQAKTILLQRHDIDPSKKILLFNGLLDYKPNTDALVAILEKINPVLLSSTGFNYQIIICGKRLPAAFNDLRDYSSKNILYAGFVDDIEIYFKGADVFLNPVSSGGGIKTKMVEAVGFGTTVISTRTGSIGIDADVCNAKLVVVNDDEWNSFAKKVISHSDDKQPTPDRFYEKYSWKNIIQNLLHSIQ